MPECEARFDVRVKRFRELCGAVETISARVSSVVLTTTACSISEAPRLHPSTMTNADNFYELMSWIKKRDAT